MNNYKELSLCDKVNGYLDLNSGKLIAEFSTFNAEDFALPLNITHLFNSENSVSCYGAGWRTSLNKQLKLAQNDTELTTIYTFTDEMGDTYTFDEKYYTVEGSGKVFVNKDEITIDINGNLTYNDKPVYKFQSCNGFTLIPEINDFINSELIEQRQSEQVEIEEYIGQHEPSLKSYIIINSQNGGKIRELSGLNKAAYEQFISGIESNEHAILVTKRQSFKLRELYDKLNSENDTELLQAQIDEIISRAQDNLPVVKDEFKKFFRKKAELELLLKQIPANYLRDKSGVINGFNKNGDLVLIADSYGKYVNLEYNSKNFIIGIYDSNKKVANFEYENDLLQSITDRRGKQVKYGYDSSDRLTTVTYPDGQTCTIKYTDTHSIATLTDGYGNCNEFTYNDAKLLKLSKKNTLTDTELSRLDVTFGQDNSVTLTSEKGEIETYKFNNENKLIKFVTCDEREYQKNREYSYGNNNKKITSTTTDNVSSYFMREIRDYDELNLLTTYTVDWHEVSYNTSEKTETKYSYDMNNKLVSKTTKQYIRIDDDPEEGGNVENFEYNHVENYSYDTNGNLTLTESYIEEEMQTSGINFEERVYNDDGNMIKCIRWNSLDSSTKFYEEYERDENGRLKYEKDEAGAYSAMYEYIDGTNVVNSVTYANGGKLAYGRNPNNHQITAVTQSTAEGEANTTDTVYENGLPVKVTSGNTTLEYEYDVKGKKTQVKVNGAVQTTYDYDDSQGIDSDGTYNFGGQTVTYETGSGDVTIQKTVQGTRRGNVLELCELTKINGQTYKQTDYNAQGSVRRITDYTNASSIKKIYYEYRENGSLWRVMSRGETAADEILREERSYNMRGELSVKEFKGEVNQVYNYAYKDNAKRELAYVVNNGYRYTPLTDVYGRNKGKEIYNATKKVAGEYITYRKVGDHATNMPAVVRYAGGEKQLQEVENIKYKYDSCGNISEITENGHLVARYTYDSLNRLIREDNKPLNKTVIYAYDNAGNITERCQYDYTEYSIVPHTEYSGGHYNYDYDGDKLISYNGETFEYNNLGNPTKYRGNVCVWQYGTQLTKYRTTTFVYDSLGRRTKKGSTTFWYDSDGRIIKQSDGLEFMYDASGIAGVKYGIRQFFYRKDAQGNIKEILDADGKAVIKYVYDAWGNHKTYCLDYIAGEGEFKSVDNYDRSDFNIESTKYYELAKLNPFRYRGYYYDTETKLYYLQTRYYDPEVGRFISQDSVEFADPEAINGLNLYAYCGNNPVMNVDPTGSAWWQWLLGIVIVVAAVVLSVATAGLATPISAALGGGMFGAIVGGAVAGAIGGAITGFGFSVAVQGISNGFNDIYWEKVGFAALGGAITGAILGGLGGGIKYAKAASYLKSNGITDVKGTLKNFKGIPSVKTSNGTIGYRYYDGINALQKGRYLTNALANNPVKDLVLYNNSATMVSKFAIQNGAKYLVGTIANSPVNAVQYFVANLNWLTLIV